VVMNHSLEHLPDPNDELGEVARLLVPGGRLHLAVPNGASVRFALGGPAWVHLSPPLHYWFFDARSLAALLDRHGLRPVGSPRTSSRHHPLLTWARTCREAGVGQATGALARFVLASVRTRDGGDVLRLEAERPR